MYYMWNTTGCKLILSVVSRPCTELAFNTMLASDEKKDFSDNCMARSKMTDVAAVVV
jgi:hypothetical protein